MSEALTLVFAGPKGRATTLRSIVEQAGWQLQSASDWRRALNLAEHAHASVFVYDRDSSQAVLYLGDAGWETQHAVIDGAVPELVLSETEQLWVRACWRAAASNRKEVQ